MDEQYRRQATGSSPFSKGAARKRPDNVHFRFRSPDWPASAHTLRAEVRRFLAEERERGGFTPRVNSWMHHDAEFSARCGERGFIGLTLPAEFGGHGRSALERYIVCEEMLAAGAPVGLHWIADRQSGPQIARHGSLAMKRKILPQIAAGRCCFGIGMSEPDAGSDLASVRTRADRTTRGWRITGTKLWTSNAHRARYVIVLARTAPPEKDRGSDSNDPFGSGTDLRNKHFLSGRRGNRQA